MTVFVNAIMYYKVKNAIHAVANVDDFGGSARLLAATTLRNVLGTMTLGEILSHRENIAKEMKVGWGKSLKWYMICTVYRISNGEPMKSLNIKYLLRSMN